LKKKNSSEVIRFIGVSLAGGKTDKACLSVIEYYPKGHRIFLSRVFDKIKNEDQWSVDLKLHELIEQYSGALEYIAFDVPWSLPLCLTCKLKCPGFEACKEPHIQWMWQHHEQHTKKKKPKKLFTPYTQRAVELYAQTEFEEAFHLPHMLGSNSAPLVARASFIARRFKKLPLIEVNPKIATWRIGRAFAMNRSQLLNYRHSVEGATARRALIHELSQRDVAFLYEQDQRLMIDNPHAFDSFICALTAYLKFRGQTEKKPPHFPKMESWIEFPQIKIHW